MDWVRRVDVVIWTADRHLQKLARGLLSESAQVSPACNICWNITELLLYNSMIEYILHSLICCRFFTAGVCV